MAKLVFDFSELIIYCLHDKKINFTNAISQEVNCKMLLVELFQSIQFACQKELEELLEMNHFHLVEKLYLKEKISKLANKNMTCLFSRDDCLATRELGTKKKTN